MSCNFHEFHLKSNCLLLFTRNRRHRWVFCRHDEIQKYNIQKLRQQDTVEENICYLPSCIADWELQLQLPLPSITRKYHTACC